MNDNKNIFYDEEKTISLIDLFFYVLKQWKLMVVAAVVLAIAAMGFTYMQSSRIYGAQMTAHSMSLAEKLENINLTEDEKLALQSKIDVMEENKENIAEYDYYLENSVKAKLNPNGFYEGTLNYMLSAESKVDLEKALEMCYENVFSENNYEILAGMLTDETDATLLKEVILTNKELEIADLSTAVLTKYEADTMFTVTVKHYMQSDCEKMLTFFEEEMEKMQDVFVTENLNVNIYKVTAYVKTCSDTSLIAISRDIKNAKSSAYDMIATIKKNMTDAERTYYELSQKEETEAPDSTIEESSTAMIPKPFVNLKHVMVAAIAGAVCVAVFYGVFYLFNGRIHNKEELESWLKLPILELDENVEMVTTLLAEIAGRKEVDKLYLTGSHFEENVDLMQKVQKLLVAKGVEVVVGKSVIWDAQSLQDAAKCGFVVFMEKCNISKEKDVKEEIEKVTACGIFVLGMILEK